MNEAVEEITMQERKRAYHDLRGTKCACGARKQVRQSLCRLHYFALPEGMRRDLYQEADYPAHYKAALKHLGLVGIEVKQ